MSLVRLGHYINHLRERWHHHHTEHGLVIYETDDICRDPETVCRRTHG